MLVAPRFGCGWLGGVGVQVKGGVLVPLRDLGVVGGSNTQICGVLGCCRCLPGDGVGVAQRDWGVGAGAWSNFGAGKELGCGCLGQFQGGGGGWTSFGVPEGVGSCSGFEVQVPIAIFGVPGVC